MKVVVKGWRQEVGLSRSFSAFRGSASARDQLLDDPCKVPSG